MRCSKCGAENADRAKFCEECASPLVRRCPSCQTENSPTAKFCVECAKPLGGAGGKSHGGPKKSLAKKSNHGECRLAQRRAQNAHRTFCQHQGLDETGPALESRGGAPDHRPAPKKNDRRRPPLRWVRAEHWGRHLR